jgi:hypothetical protein
MIKNKGLRTLTPQESRQEEGFASYYALVEISIKPGRPNRHMNFKMLHRIEVKYQVYTQAGK